MGGDLRSLRTAGTGGRVSAENHRPEERQMTDDRHSDRERSVTYEAAGVRTHLEDEALAQIAHWVNKTFSLNECEPALPLGYFANVLKIPGPLWVAISTDGVGTKLLVAQELGKFDSVGIDCVAMNANDVICVGARPISMVDYVAVEKLSPKQLGKIAEGLFEGARAAAVNIPGGEIAQIGEMIRGTAAGNGFDLVGTCIGTVPANKLIVGQKICPRDAIVGIESSGVHSNGLTLARRVLFERAKLRLEGRVPELQRSLGEELLVPTNIYVREVMQMIDEGLKLKALIHITSDGLLNLSRVEAPAGFVVDDLLGPQPIFSVIQERGKVPAAEMFRVFNMGTGFCVVVDPGDAERVREIAKSHGRRAKVVGHTVHDPERKVWIPQRHLVGRGKTFKETREAPPQ
jgi:phosphoribosylformylglycinamidine cyclo-ligase